MKKKNGATNQYLRPSKQPKHRRAPSRPSRRILPNPPTSHPIWSFFLFGRPWHCMAESSTVKAIEEKLIFIGNYDHEWIMIMN